MEPEKGFERPEAFVPLPGEKTISKNDLVCHLGRKGNESNIRYHYIMRNDLKTAKSPPHSAKFHPGHSRRLTGEPTPPSSPPAMAATPCWGRKLNSETYKFRNFPPSQLLKHFTAESQMSRAVNDCSSDHFPLPLGCKTIHSLKMQDCERNSSRQKFTFSRGNEWETWGRRSPSLTKDRMASILGG